LGMEWFFRLAMEPRRLWRRYLVGNTEFILLVLRQWMRERLRDARRRRREAEHDADGAIVPESGD